MPPDADRTEDAHPWLLRAKGNLARARQPKPPEAFWEDLCFDAQQAAEKALKAVLAHDGIVFPKTHQIAELLTLLRNAGREVPEELWQGDKLTDYAVQARYPSPDVPVTEAEYREALYVADQIVLWAEEIIRAG